MLFGMRSLAIEIPYLSEKTLGGQQMLGQSETLSPLLISGRTSPSIMKVGETWCRSAGQACNAI